MQRDFLDKVEITHLTFGLHTQKIYYWKISLNLKYVKPNSVAVCDQIPINFRVVYMIR